MQFIYTNLLGFVFCAVVIFLAGRKLSFYGSLLSEITGLGKAWIGLILMAAVTSLPELVSTISAAKLVGSADLAVGGIMGSCAFNLGIIALIDAITPQRRSLLGSASTSHILAAALGIILVAIAAVGLSQESDIVITPGLGITSIVFAGVYFFSVRLLYQFNTSHPELKEVFKDDVHPLPSKGAVIGFFCLYSLIIIVAALFLPGFADQIAMNSHLSGTFVGTLFLAIATSLPEIAVSIAAVRTGNIDMSVGNLLGSNIFNMFILFIADIAYSDGHILKVASDTHILSALAVVIMSSIAIIGLLFKVQGKRYLLAWDAFLIFLVYAINMFLLYKMS